VSCPRSKAHIEGEQLLDFLKELVEAVPQLPPAGSEPAKAPKPKRQRWGGLLACLSGVHRTPASPGCVDKLDSRWYVLGSQ
jgi:hypothetical protein